MKDFFEGIASLFEDVLFIPFDLLRNLELQSWFLANFMNWIFVIIAFAAFIFWMLQLKKFNDNDEEDRDPTAHSFLG
ncbi:MAG: uracil phosphoribosyltransferase [Gillisia sp.]